MKIKQILFLTLFCLLFAFSNITALAADTVTVTDKTDENSISTALRKIIWTFSSDDGTIARTATYTVNGTASQTVANVWGTIVRAHWVPDGTNTPDAAADIQLYIHLTTGVNILYGLFDNVGATETMNFPVTTTNAGPVFLAGDTLYFSAASLGAGTNGGVLTIWVLRP